MEKIIVFQGDSITDSDRDHSGDTHTGRGYVSKLIGHISADYPGQYKFYNRGVSGNRLSDLYIRAKTDIIDLKPDILSILIGINDVWTEIAGGPAITNEEFERLYDLLIKDIKLALPDIEIILLGLFMLEGRKTRNTDEYPTRYDRFRTGVLDKNAAIKRVADKNGLIFIPLQETFEKLSKDTDTSIWLSDGAHATPAGHEIIKREWLKYFEAII